MFSLSRWNSVFILKVQWLVDNYETAEGVSLPRSTLYNHYLQHCQANKLDAVNAASFGKLIRSVFMGLRTRRLGTRSEWVCDPSFLGSNTRDGWLPDLTHEFVEKDPCLMTPKKFSLTPELWKLFRMLLPTPSLTNFTLFPCQFCPFLCHFQPSSVAFVTPFSLRRKKVLQRFLLP